MPAYVISEELLDAELPKETSQETSHGNAKISTAAFCSKNDVVVTSTPKDKQNVSSMQFQLSDRLGAKVTSGSVLDRLGVKKVMHESNSPLLRITDRLSNKIVAPVSDSANRKSIPAVSQPEQNNISVAQVAPTTVKTVARTMNVDTATEQFGLKTMQRPMDEEETSGKDQVRGHKVLSLMFRPVKMD